ncbi:MAG: DUF92 domain-containing protein, partial [Acidobacteria bacterium]|nr:DUF92 domain-containing protein [Acidobacteriota bacterium]
GEANRKLARRASRKERFAVYSPANWRFSLVGPLALALPPGRRFIGALLLTIAFALAARFSRSVSQSGTIAGAALAFILYLGGGAGMFAALVTVFIIAFATTRLGYWRKHRLGLAESREGRGASQVLANISAAAGMAALAIVADHPEGWLIAAVAALAEAAADTASSEFGQAVSRRAYLIANFSQVPVGTDGGISVWGTLAGALAAFLVSAVATVTRVIPVHWLVPAAAIAVLGMFVDSLLGACFERRDLLNNDVVNFTSTAVSALVAVLLYAERHGPYWLT